MIYFFDTSALQHRYIDSPKSRGVRGLISRKRNWCYIADVSVLEISSALAKHCRRGSLSEDTYTKLDQAFWRDVHRGRVAVYDTGQREYLRARNLIRYAGVARKRNITSADALIAAACLEFALGEKQQVTFCLEDWTLYHILQDISAYKRVLRFHYIGVDKSIAAPKVT